jgi:hypothetical protein
LAVKGGIPWTFNSTTNPTGISTGQLRVNNAAIASVNEIYISDFTTAGSSDESGWIATWDDSTSTHKGYLLVQPSAFNSFVSTLFQVNTVTDNGTYFTLGVTYLAGGGTYTNGVGVLVDFNRTGDAGTQGAQGTQGVQGLLGSGSQGTQGLAGSSQGVQGTQGVQGLLGAGSQGVQGASGGGAGASPGGSVGEIQYNDGAGGFAANAALAYSESIETLLAANVYITGNINSTSNSSGSLVINGGMGINGDIYMQGSSPYINMEGIATEPTAPAANNIILYGKNIGGRMLPKFVGPSGFDTALQPLIGTNRFALWNPPPQVATAPGTTVGVNGISWTTNGTLTARTIATTNMFTRMKRLGFQTASGTNNIACGAYNANATYTIGTATTPALGGFYFIAKFGDQDTTAATRFFCGFSSTVTANIPGEPSTFTNAIGVGYGTADTNYKIFYGGSAAQTPIDLGSSFPCKLANTTPMEVILFAPPNASNTVHYRITVLSTGNTTSGALTAATIGTQLPANTTLLAPRVSKNNVGTGAATGFDMSSIYIESDY